MKKLFLSLCFLLGCVTLSSAQCNCNMTNFKEVMGDWGDITYLSEDKYCDNGLDNNLNGLQIYISNKSYDNKDVYAITIYYGTKQSGWGNKTRYYYWRDNDKVWAAEGKRKAIWGRGYKKLGKTSDEGVAVKAMILHHINYYLHHCNDMNIDY